MILFHLQNSLHGNRKDREMAHRYNGLHDQNLRRKTTFLPMLCSKPSIKDVILPECDRNRSDSLSGDPLSPRIGCMGQVKRNNRVAGLPIFALTTKNAVGSNSNVRYLKLKKFFSSKNLLASAAAAPDSRGSRRRTIRNCTDKKNVVRNGNCDSLNVVDLDPPLPVIKRAQKPGEGGEMENLWKRRFGGTVLQSLQIQQTQIPKHRIQITTV